LALKETALTGPSIARMEPGDVRLLPPSLEKPFEKTPSGLSEWWAANSELLIAPAVGLGCVLLLIVIVFLQRWQARRDKKVAEQTEQ
jgi:hypothetical protein